MNKVLRQYEELSAAIDAIATHVLRYEAFATDLRLARSEQAALRRARPQMRVQFDDLEAELTYLRIRAHRPATVVQVGSQHGWSTGWILRALRDNGHGRLYSFDRTGAARGNLPPELAAGRWQLVEGDARRTIDRVPSDIDYLFIDGARSTGFAKWYLPNLVEPLCPRTPVSIHNIFHHRHPLPFGEASVVIKWLQRNNIEYFTAAPARQPVVYRQLNRSRFGLGFYESIHTGRHNPTAFFETA